MAKEIVTEKVVSDIATLSRLEFSREEVKSIQKDLNEIVEYFSVLQEVDTSKLDSVMTQGEGLREDVEKESMSPADAVKNAPEHNNNSFIVPRVVE